MDESRPTLTAANQETARPAKRWGKRGTLHHQAAQQLQAEQLRDRINQLAGDVGQLRRSLQPDTTAWWRAERIANHVEDLHLMLEPTAAQLALYLSGLDDGKYAEAIRIVDARHKSLQQRLATNGH